MTAIIKDFSTNRGAPAEGRLRLAEGTRVATLRGEILVEELEPGARVLTRDLGLQTVIGVARAIGTEGAVTLRTGCLGAGLPESDLTVAPDHAVLVFGEIAREFFGADEVFVEARCLTMIEGVEAAAPAAVYDIVLSAPVILLTNGAWSESLTCARPAAEEDGLFVLFPALRAVPERVSEV
ncbi:Hint domain-containing protein [Histidinibacterium aquaticum]|nr:Hint domain-containing protein [Histidinibacterium aquaticum]